jgi:hypothetical protein
VLDARFAPNLRSTTEDAKRLLSGVSDLKARIMLLALFVASKLGGSPKDIGIAKQWAAGDDGQAAESLRTIANAADLAELEHLTHLRRRHSRHTHQTTHPADGLAHRASRPLTPSRLALQVSRRS